MIGGTGGAIVSWIDDTDGAGVIRLRRVRPDGRLSAPLDAAETSLTRGAGFPRLARLGGELLLVWTISEEDTSRLAGVVVPATLLPLSAKGPGSGE